MGMQAALRARAEPVIGILNGVDYQEWDPRARSAPDGALLARGLARQARQQAAAARGASASSIAPRSPLIGMVTRLASQKGIDILIDALPHALEERDFGLAVLGSGDERYAAFFDSLAAALSAAASRFARATMSRWPI